MQKVKPTTKEQLIYYMLQNVSLGTYDKRFLTNIQTLHVVPKKPTTTNQTALFDKIISRYRRQLVKQELLVNELLSLPWTTQPIESLPQYTEAYITIEEDRVVVRSPFKTEFVKEFRDYRYSEWHRDTKTWSTPMSEEILKQVIDITIKHYDHVNFCEQIKTIVNTLSEYTEDMYWTPTLVKVNGKFLIAASNSSLENSIQDIELSDNPAVLARLTYHGVEVSKEIKESCTPEVKFAIDRASAIDFDTDLLISRIDAIEPDFVLMTDWFGVPKGITAKICNELSERNIKYHIIDKRKSFPEGSLRDYKLPIILSSWSFISNSLLAGLAAKTITLVNNNPIQIK